MRLPPSQIRLTDRIGLRHGENLLAAEIHPMMFLRVLLKFRVQGVIGIRPGHKPAVALDHLLDHRWPPLCLLSTSPSLETPWTNLGGMWENAGRLCRSESTSLVG